MRIFTTGNALSLTFVLAYLPLALVRSSHFAGAGTWHSPMALGMRQAGSTGQGAMMGNAPAGLWHMAGSGYGEFALAHLIFGSVIAYGFGWYVATIFVSLYRFFERRAQDNRE